MNLPDITILYEDAQILVCKKPAGIAVQSARLSAPDMVSILKNHLHQNSSSTTTEPYLAVIHRLDQPVEGVLVFAKTPFAAKELNKEMQNGGFGKHYHALVSEAPPKKQDTIEDYMVKDGRTNTSRICAKGVAGAKLARLTYQVIPQDHTSESENDSTLLDITLDTGRHHQIRVQMAHMGCPIVGDQKYGIISQSHVKTRLALCAYKLEFHHPKTKKAMTFYYEE
ncbi:MAG: RluA family pseudouridine synthase [Hespellia sp.]|nr:RluA family pseudouridine synthase [Hespellia sp.]